MPSEAELHLWKMELQGLTAPSVRQTMAYKETFWMACDSVEESRAEYGPFVTREEAEGHARRLGFGYVLRYEHLVDDSDEIQEVRSIFVELPPDPAVVRLALRWHTRCATCGEAATHEAGWRAEVWADIHEFEHSRHFVRLFERTEARDLREVADWRHS